MLALWRVIFWTSSRSALNRVCSLFVSSPSLFLSMSRSSSSFDCGSRCFNSNLGFWKLNQILEAHIQRLADGSDNTGIKFLNRLGCGKPIETLFIHFKATLL